VEVAGRSGEVRVSALPDNPLRRLAALGQSIWLDYIERALLAGGELERLIRVQKFIELCRRLLATLARRARDLST
jgi:hypothetical protein